jgi:hypothetical protein
VLNFGRCSACQIIVRAPRKFFINRFLYIFPLASNQEADDPEGNQPEPMGGMKDATLQSQQQPWDPPVMQSSSSASAHSMPSQTSSHPPVSVICFCLSFLLSAELI